MESSVANIQPLIAEADSRRAEIESAEPTDDPRLLYKRTVSDALDFIRRYLDESIRVLQTLPEDDIAELISLVEDARDRKARIFVCGNGGSAATSSHLATELGKMASVGRPTRFQILSLADNSPWVTALANDGDFDDIFVEQIRNFAQPGDLLLAFSGSGRSSNVLKAVEWANENDLVSVGLTGRLPCPLADIARYPIRINSQDQGQIEEGHFVIQHLVSYYFMR